MPRSFSVYSRSAETSCVTVLMVLNLKASLVLFSVKNLDDASVRAVNRFVVKGVASVILAMSVLFLIGAVVSLCGG